VESSSCTYAAIDCDDSNAAVNPGTGEVCNGRDDNCNAGIDENVDADRDGVNDCTADRCLGTVIDEMVLAPNNYGDIDGDRVFEINTGSSAKPVYKDSAFTMVDTLGCSCTQILQCKAGNNGGELKYGCTSGTIQQTWIPQKGWAKDCRVDGNTVRNAQANPFSFLDSLLKAVTDLFAKKK